MPLPPIFMRFLINTLTHWEEAPRTRHHVATTLAKNHKVDFVTANKTGFPRLSKKNDSTGVQLIVPFFPIPHKIRYRIPLLNHIYQKWLYRKLSAEYSSYTVI